MFNVWINSLNAGSVISCVLKDGSVNLNPFRRIFLKKGKNLLKTNQMKWRASTLNVKFNSSFQFYPNWQWKQCGLPNHLKCKKGLMYCEKTIDKPFYIHPFIHIFCGNFCRQKTEILNNFSWGNILTCDFQYV